MEEKESETQTETKTGRDRTDSRQKRETEAETEREKKAQRGSPQANFGFHFSVLRAEEVGRGRQRLSSNLGHQRQAVQLWVSYTLL